MMIVRILLMAVFSAAVAVPAFAQDRSYKVLATTRTGTMEREMQQAAQAGYRFVAVMGGETALGSKEVVVLMERAQGATNNTTFSYRLLATNRTGTLQKEIQQAADAGYQIVGQTVFESAFGGKETAVIVEKGAPGAPRWEYRLVATSKTSTLQKELNDLTEQGFEAIDLTVGKTALGGNELVVIARKPVK